MGVNNVPLVKTGSMHKNREVLSEMDDSILELKLNYIYLQNTRGREC